MRIPRNIICAIAAICWCLPANAQDLQAPEGSKIVVTLNLDAIQETKLGAQLLKAARAAAAEEFGDEQDPEEAFSAIEEALGFDPFNELQSVTIFAKNLEDPLEGFLGVLSMGETTGNLEGLMLALPGYEASEYGEYTMHSVSPDDRMRVFAAIHGSKKKHVIVGTKEKNVKSMLDSLGNRGSSSSDRSGDAALATVQVLELPNIDDIDGPPKALLKLAKKALISVRESGEDLKLSLDIETRTEKHAEQLQQLAQGAAAMVSLANDTEDDEDLERVAGILETLEVERDGESIQLSVKLPEELVIEFLREEVDLPIER